MDEHANCIPCRHCGGGCGECRLAKHVAPSKEELERQTKLLNATADVLEALMEQQKPQPVQEHQMLYKLLEKSR